jgi:hypothetical protein
VRGRMSEREGSPRERRARRAGRLAAPRAGADMGGVPASLSEERTRRRHERPQGEPAPNGHEGGRCG